MRVTSGAVLGSRIARVPRGRKVFPITKQDIIFCLTYWDVLFLLRVNDWPLDMPIELRTKGRISIKGDRSVKNNEHLEGLDLLQQAGLIQHPQVEFNPPTLDPEKVHINRLPVDEFHEYLLRAPYYVASEIARQAGSGDWRVVQGAPIREADLPDPPGASAGHRIVLTLGDILPAPSENVPPELLMDFRSRRGAELAALCAAQDALLDVTQDALSPGIPSELSARTATAVSDYWRVMHESIGVGSVGSMKIHARITTTDAKQSALSGADVTSHLRIMQPDGSVAIPAVSKRMEKFDVPADLAGRHDAYACLYFLRKIAPSQVCDD